MLKQELIDFLNDNNLEFIDILKDEEDYTIFRMSYKFDKLELEGANAYADEECDGDKDEWNYDFFLPYLNDMAVDNVNDILDDFCEDELDFQFIAFDVPIEETKYNDFICSISIKDNGVNLEEYLLEVME
ncbi:hypothetical protein [Oceanirhabdus seepicola]|uniref:Uncharacterized protein n=1 Tax=Oceanirhabdus seepicola TaxID=2828781 RepID=A0A9J6P2L8_9CLOT|nr:hypothetical protein [Oceanirhabdus seepicola]MCM1990628.1 hypothetical protein [Oceanirhabdus seepicola]